MNWINWVALFIILGTALTALGFVLGAEWKHRNLSSVTQKVYAENTLLVDRCNALVQEVAALRNQKDQWQTQAMQSANMLKEFMLNQEGSNAPTRKSP